MSYDPKTGDFYRCPLRGRYFIAPKGSSFGIESKESISRRRHGIDTEAIREKGAYLCKDHAPAATVINAEEVLVGELFKT